jgi:ubiquinone/menaquinone biosynthesis C-methylase UbiE
VVCKLNPTRNSLREVNDLWKHKALELFESLAQRHATERAQRPGFRWQLEITFRMLEANQGKVLDVGCASGVVTDALRNRGLSVVGIDFSPGMINQARHRIPCDNAVQFCRADAEYLPFPDGSFDYVICLGVLEFLYDFRQLIAEIARVLRPRGLAVFSIPNRISPYHLAYRSATSLCHAIKPVSRMWRSSDQNVKARYAFQSHWNSCIPWWFRKLLSNEGLEPQQDSYSSFFVFPLDRIWPAANDWLVTALEYFRQVPLLSWTASQYMVSVRKCTSGKPRV